MVSDLGRVDFPDRIGDWEVSSLQFFSTMSITAQMAFCAVTSNSVPHLNACYLEGRISAERTTRVADDALAILLKEIGA